MAKYCVSWDSYTDNIAKGFCRLQQNAEFVDMTLAAEGHFVKVHQNIVALASPYLKQILQSVPCQHPIIFLSNMSHNVLSYFLEYIYFGEVKIPQNEVSKFIEACKVLHVTGIENVILPESTPSKPKETEFDLPVTNPPDNNYAAHITINAHNYNLEVNPIENNINKDNLFSSTVNDVMDLTLACPMENEKVVQITAIIEDNTMNHNSICNLENVLNKRSSQKIIDKHKVKKTQLKPSWNAVPLDPDNIYKDSIPQYSISNRCSVQLLFNRYLYHCHHQSHEGRKRRWRCIDYRKIRCPATIDTDGETIVNRAEVHSHPYHDSKILKKYKHKSVFTSLSYAEEKISEVTNKGKHNLNKEEQDISISQLS